ncbi:MAG: electron transfer flavoprotein subunit beta/FixA family protein [Proteobacteria bacterium]|nr:electron transfer flavoprotein subunit beta/FixA family protein [Pseudomonadota bacterium]MBU1964478.1 electron transfer flavoprotein subunit beta/FixA family protein [Pseudomonadota bacterium]MBU4582746.1 electron transfer flavoprotein subunit beta/FixA family protein [Pseudomonadota bacterium]
MMKMVVCIKQVPMVSELPWDPATGTLQRDLAEGMMNPACRSALDAALRIKETAGGEITAITMGPPMAEEVLREAIALGADRGILLTDRKMAGADTSVTSHTLARAIERACQGFDLVLCGCSTSDSETAQVGPQLAEELDIPGVAYVDEIELSRGAVRMRRISDHFLETLEMDLPGIVTVTTGHYAPRHVPLGGLQAAFTGAQIDSLDAEAVGLDPERIGARGSATKIRNVFSPTAGKKNIVLTGAPKRIVEQLFDLFDDKIGGAIGKDLKTDKNSK